MIREGRLGKEMEREALEYVSSFPFDRRIFEYDLLGDMAHLLMLMEQGVLSEGEGASILRELKRLWEAGMETLSDTGKEDIHLLIEEHLLERLGPLAGRMHAGRSRNDQIACDLRLWVREEVVDIGLKLAALLRTLLRLSREQAETLMPGYTHLQPAQPTTLGHHLLAHHDALYRDLERLEEAYTRIDRNPLGSGALATTGLPIDRERTTSLLGFGALVEHSMDAVASRDFLLEGQTVLALLFTDLSRCLEDLILWQTEEFGYLELDNRYASTSSIMPQKKNPDLLEVMRARCGRGIGNLASALTIVRSLPYAYDRDLQELSPLLQETFTIAREALSLLPKALETASFRKERMKEAAERGWITATDLADLLVREKGLPFRTAHQIVGRLVFQCHEKGIGRGEVDGRLLDEIAEEVTGRPLDIGEEGVRDALDPEKAVKRRGHRGGPSPQRVRSMVAAREKALRRIESSFQEKRKRQREVRERLLETVEKITGR
jgi:argininosuccinate lyase